MKTKQKLTITEKIVLVKQRSGLNETQFSARAGVAIGTYGNIRDGKNVNPSTIGKFEKAYGINPEWLYEDKDVDMFISGVDPIEHSAQAVSPWRDELYAKMAAMNTYLQDKYDELMRVNQALIMRIPMASSNQDGLGKSESLGYTGALLAQSSVRRVDRN